jgi:hypothetical protein
VQFLSGAFRLSQLGELAWGGASLPNALVQPTWVEGSCARSKYWPIRCTSTVRVMARQDKGIFCPARAASAACVVLLGLPQYPLHPPLVLPPETGDAGPLDPLEVTPVCSVPQSEMAPSSPASSPAVCISFSCVAAHLNVLTVVK